MKILVSGGREWDNWDRVIDILSMFDPDKTTVIEGEARGLDIQVRKAAEFLGFSSIVKMPADWYPAWNKGKLFRGAGPVRNSEMLKLKPDLVIGFHNDFANSKGTKHCLGEAVKLGYLTWIVTDHTLEIYRG